MDAVRRLRMPFANTILLGLLMLTSAARGAPARSAQPARRLAPAGLSLARPHPKHIVRVWRSAYKGHIFHVTELPRCQHLEAVFSYDSSGETRARAERRLHGIAACTGSFHNPRTMALADFLQKDGNIISGATTGRWFFAMTDDGEFTISDDYSLLKGQRGVSAIALGQRLVPLHRDGFSRSFMNRETERMALGLSRRHIYIVEGKSDLWALSGFLRKKLSCSLAINSDGGHVVQGRAPVHIVFRWRRTPLKPAPVLTARRRPAAPKLVPARRQVPGSASAPPDEPLRAQQAAPRGVARTPRTATMHPTAVQTPQMEPTPTAEGLGGHEKTG